MKIKSVLLLLSLLCLKLSYAHQEEFYLLSGKFGKDSVGVRIDEIGEKVVLRYFKVGELIETEFDGHIVQPGKFRFSLPNFDTGIHIVLEEYELNQWKGTYIDSVGNKSVIELSPINVQKINHSYLSAIIKYKVDAYTALKTRSVHFSNTSISKIKKAKVIKVSDNLANINSFRVAFKGNKVQADSINDFLVAMHLKHIANALSSKLSNLVYNLDYHIHSLTSQYISFSETLTTNYLSGKNWTQNQNFNKWISTAKDIILEEMLWFGNKEIANVRYQSYEWHQYRYKIFGDSLLSLLSELYPDNIYKSVKNPCDYSNVKGWQFPSWYILPKGIYFKYTIVSKDKECNNSQWSVLPWKRIEQYLLINN